MFQWLYHSSYKEIRLDCYVFNKQNGIYVWVYACKRTKNNHKKFYVRIWHLFKRHITCCLYKCLSKRQRLAVWYVETHPWRFMTYNSCTVKILTNANKQTLWNDSFTKDNVLATKLNKQHNRPFGNRCTNGTAETRYTLKNKFKMWREY